MMPASFLQFNITNNVPKDDRAAYTVICYNPFYGTAHENSGELEESGNDMEDSLFREKAIEKISSPEDLGNYLHVTRPSVWLILVAVILLLAGMLVWSSVASIDSFATGTAVVKDGTMYIHFDNEQIAENVEGGMTVIAGESENRISSVGTDDTGELFAVAPTDLTDGSYTVHVIFKKTRVLSLLFN